MITVQITLLIAINVQIDHLPTLMLLLYLVTTKSTKVNGISFICAIKTAATAL